MNGTSILKCQENSKCSYCKGKLIFLISNKMLRQGKKWTDWLTGTMKIQKYKTNQ